MMKMEMDDDDLEEIIFDDLEDGREQEEEDEKVKPWVMFVTFGGLIVLAAIICALLWFFTHSGNEEGTPAGSNLPTESVTDTLAPDLSEEAAKPDTNNDSGINPDEETDPEQGQDAAGAGTGKEPENAGGEQGKGQEGTKESSAGQGMAATQPAEAEKPMEEPVSGTTSMEFAEVNEEVTAKDVTNLRSAPTVKDSENVVAQLKNGDKLSRTGTNSSTGWSRLVYNGETVYAVTQFLTTDLNYKPPVAENNPNRVVTQDNRVIIFTDCSDNITPKEYVNLRTEPSTSQGEATVKCQVNSGETVVRTGYSADSGWSRVEYNGEVLYVVSSLVKTVQ